MSLSMDTSVTPARLVIGTGGKFNTVRELDPTTGATLWSHVTPGDGQAVAAIGDSVVVGYHRNRPNVGSLPWPFYGTQLAASDGSFQTWQPGLSGHPGQIPDNGNNGIRSMVFDPTSHVLYVAGAFTKYGATCNPVLSIVCTGGRAMNALAAYPVTSATTVAP
jgi:hypothetical protein